MEYVRKGSNMMRSDDRYPREVKEWPCGDSFFAVKILMVLALMASPAIHAQTDRNWTNASGGTFSDANNWVSGVVPGDNNSTARFATSGTYTVSFNADALCRKANFDAKGATVTLNLAGYTWNLTNWWDQGPSANNTNTVVMQNGTIRSGSDFSVAKTGARASFQMLHADSVVTNAGTFAVGNGTGGYGEFIVSNGYAHLEFLAELGNTVGSTGLLRIVNGTVKVYGSAGSGDTCLNVGDAGVGTLVLEHPNALLITTNKNAAHLGYTGTGNGTVIISNGVWDANGIFIGHRGLGALIMQGGMITNRSRDIAVSYQYGTGSLVMASADARLYSNGGLALGGEAGAGEASVILSNGLVAASHLNMGWRADSIGSSYTQMGGTSRFTTANSALGNNSKSTGTVTMAAGVMDFGSSTILTVGSSGKGYLTVSGGDFFANELRLGGAANGLGRFTLSGGTATVANLNLFAASGSSGATAEFTQSGGVLKLGRYGAYTPSSATTNIWLSGGTWVATNHIDTAALACNLTLTNSPGVGVFTFNSGNYTVIQHGAISGPGSLIKTGNGTLRLRGANSYSGNTTVEQGTLASEYAGGITNSPIITVKSGASIDVSLAADPAMNIENGELIQGAGSIVGTLALHHGTIIPGDDGPGTFSASSLVLTSGTIQIEMSNAAGSAGVDWGMIRVNGGSGNVTNLATSSDAITIDFTCSSPSLTGFTGVSPMSWRIIDAANHIGFASNKFVISTANFNPVEKFYGSFTVSSNAGDLVINYTPSSAPVDLSVSVAASTNFAVSGFVLTYTVVVSNHSGAVSGLYHVTNSLGGNLSFVGGTTGAVFTGGNVIWSLGGLAGGASTTLLLNATPLFTGSTQQLSTVVHSSVAHVNGDPTPGNNSSSSGTVTTVGIPTLSTWAFIVLAGLMAYIFYRRHRTVAAT